MLCMRNRATAEGYNHSREPKNSGIDQQLTADSANIVATVCVQAYVNYTLISTPHSIPDASQLLNLPLPTHELWVQATQIHHLLGQTQAAAQEQKHRKATAGSYELDQCYSTSSNSAESSKQLKVESEHLPQQARTVMLTDYTREMSLRTSSASSKRPKAISKRSVSARGVQRYHSYFNRSCLPSAIEEYKRTRPSSLVNLTANRNWEQIRRQLKQSLIFPLANRSCNRSHSTPQQRSLKLNNVAESYCRNWTHHPLLIAEQLTNICSQRNNRSLTQLKLTQLTSESSSLIQNTVVPTNPNDDA
ncbi:histone-lysine N-methyltransferase ASHR2 [Dorcoceras hygrometricum]|uniref:Histone-lysine N-methyltransferase ASHR2 n=1 Tax=Dorcoceras hygrometricum TaxID=472368 RepID=A0A2Z7BMG5_9LAMI|nr:histone-lysine N-methyltransferase ASHR2 [Dorcoceras hygrometricum]